MAHTKTRVGILFGGRSCEHEVSLQSARSVLGAMDAEKYDPVLVGVTKAGEWVTMDPARLGQEREAAPGSGALVSLLPDPGRAGLIPLEEEGLRAPVHGLDVVFPLIHGPLGEDGTVQGLLELAGIAYVGSGVLGSALGMDKAAMKAMLEHQGLSVAPYRVVKRTAWEADPIAVHRACEHAFAYPWFVKPANLGSSVGVSKVHDCTEFTDAMENAAAYDAKLIVERGIENAREIEVAVLGNDELEASVPGEIVPANEFYDYEAKYRSEATELIIPADLPPPVVERLRAYATRAFKAIDCAGLARVDFLVRRADFKIFLSEVNTLPGFTTVSMYPKLWQASGLPYAGLIDRLLELALERHRSRNRNRKSYSFERPRPASTDAAA